VLSDRCPICPVLSCLSVCLVCNVGVMWPISWMDQDETWRAGRPRPWPRCVRWGPSSPSHKGAQPPQCLAHICCDKWLHELNGTWYGGRPRPRRICVTWRFSSPSLKGGKPHPQFSAHHYCGETTARIKMPLGTEVGLVPGDIVLDGTQLPLPEKRGTTPQPPIFGPCLLWPNGCMYQNSTWYGGMP